MSDYKDPNNLEAEEETGFDSKEVSKGHHEYPKGGGCGVTRGNARGSSKGARDSSQRGKRRQPKFKHKKG